MGKYYTSGDFAASAVQCPFFKGITDKAVICEGWERDGHILENRFRKNDDKKEFVREWCCERYKECEVYRLCMRKYE